MTIAPMPRLRPLGLGQLLDQAIRLYRQNFFKFIGIVAIVQIPLGLIQLGISLVTLDGIAQLRFLDDVSSPRVYQNWVAHASPLLGQSIGNQSSRRRWPSIMS